jgi:hypothetical protein
LAKKAKLVKRKLHVRWDTTAKRWLARNQMPNGTTLALERVKDGRRVRGDTIIHRHKLPLAADDDDSLSEALAALQGVMITNIEARQQRLRLYRPDGSHAPGNTRMGTLRRLPGLPTEEEEMQADYLEIEVDLLATGLRDELDFAEDVSSSPDVVLQAYVRALLRKFAPEQIAAAVEREQR